MGAWMIWGLCSKSGFLSTKLLPSLSIPKDLLVLKNQLWGFGNEPRYPLKKKPPGIARGRTSKWHLGVFGPCVVHSEGQNANELGVAPCSLHSRGRHVAIDVAVLASRNARLRPRLVRLMRRLTKVITFCWETQDNNERNPKVAKPDSFVKSGNVSHGSGTFAPRNPTRP